MFEPAVRMAPGGVVVSPMNDATLGVPVVLPSEIHLVSLLETRYSWRQINIVGNEQGLPRTKFQNKALMPASFVVVRKNLLDYAAAFDLEFAGLTFEGAMKDLVACGGQTLLGPWRAPEDTNREQDEEES